MCVSKVVGYADTISASSVTTWTHVFCKDIRKNKKVCETIFACLLVYGTHVESFKQQKMVNNLVTLSL